MSATKPAPALSPSVGGSASDILAECERQRSVEGWTPDHDDQHRDNELSRAAACYAIGNVGYWPWSLDWWKPTDRRRNLIKAGALIIAEIERIDRAAAPIDRSAVQLASGDPVTEDHRDIDPATGQQKGYVVLTPDERAKGFVRPYRDAYRHLKCGKITTMSRSLAETYACDPGFYSGTFCSTCRSHFPVGADGEFTWYEMDGREGPKVGI